jgi:serine protease Do
MNIRIRFVFFLLLLLNTSFAVAQERQTQKEALIAAAKPFEQLADVFRRSAEYAAPAIVHITASQTKTINSARLPGRTVQMQTEDSGSGIVAEVGGKQFVLTNRHIVEGNELNAIKIQTAERKVLTLTKVTTNEDFDLAVIEFTEKLPITADFGDSDGVKIGDFAIAYGSPFGLERSISMGIVSATGRRNIPSGAAETPRVGFFQIDAAVNPGSSGGAMLNLRGEVVGLVTAIATQGGGNDGVAFAIPIKKVLGIAEQLVKNGMVKKPFIGCAFEPTFSMKERKTLQIERNIGAKVNRVLNDSPAAKAGLQTSDVILTFNGVEVEDDKHIVNLVADSEIGKPSLININRSGKALELKMTPTSQESH